MEQGESICKNLYKEELYTSDVLSGRFSGGSVSRYPPSLVACSYESLEFQEYHAVRPVEGRQIRRLVDLF